MQHTAGPAPTYWLTVSTYHLQVFQDSRGAIVVSFSRQAAAAEGDITAYMKQLAKAGEVALQFRWVGT